MLDSTLIFAGSVEAGLSNTGETVVIVSQQGIDYCIEVEVDDLLEQPEMECRSDEFQCSTRNAQMNVDEASASDMQSVRIN